MDSNPTPQTVAQAVQAATAAAQQVAPSPPLQQSTASVPTSVTDNLTCQWQGCGERCDSAESLYDHVCERHVGRKSTNNLNLTCQWGACRTTTVKRDHITSHIRVHVPLKPHKCEFCGKAFKRPQDLKKHVKTHADDSVLMNSPQHGANGRGQLTANGVIGQTTAFPPTGYYGGHDNGMAAYGYNAIGNGGTPAYPQPTNPGQYAGYGSVSYPNSSGAMQDLQSMDTRRRAIEALNDFLGDIKRRAIDPGNYYDVGHRLQSNTLPLPVSGSGYNTGYNTSLGYGNYNTANLLDSFGGAGGSSAASGANPMATHGYSLPAHPISNARTKGDLHDIDRFLEQLQATVYETSNHTPTGGVMHNAYGNDNFFRESHSPSSIGDSSMSASAIHSLPSLAVSQSGLGTPALTPASISSYEGSSHSPMSSHSRASLSSMYPNLPTVPPASQLGSEYPTSTSAPPSSLAYGMDGLDIRTYGKSHHQRQAPPADTATSDFMDIEGDGARTPRAKTSSSPPRKPNAASNSIDPALRDAEAKSARNSASPPAASSSRSDNGVDEQWVENIRVIEALRKWISDRLRNGEYEDPEVTSVAGRLAAAVKAEEEASAAAAAAAAAAEEGAENSTSSDEHSKNIEIAKLAEATMADAEDDIAGQVTEKINDQSADLDEEMDVRYPALPSAASA